MKFALAVSSLRSVFVEEWFRVLSSSGNECIVISTQSVGAVRDLPPDLRAAVVEELPGRSTARAVEERLGQTPDAIMYWWGVHSPGDHQVSDLWPNAKQAVIVDTFPNASGIAGEAREYIRARSLIRAGFTFVVPTHAMSRTFGKLAGPAHAPSRVVFQSPFGVHTHGRYENGFDYEEGELIFLGRSDYLGSGSRAMSKDDVLASLLSLQADGYGVTVQDPGDASLRRRFRSLGLRTYDRARRVDMTDGSFSTFLSRYSGHLCIYNLSNGTIRRRVGHGLSTRLAQGLASEAPLILQPEASLSEELERLGIVPVRLGRYGLREELDQKQLVARAAWRRHHHLLAGQAHMTALVSALSDVRN